ncbi:hypothetical protein L1987_22623 [Smallanthus sonchifolius]|uniref:Uncharacterized protein n=1 Tax=Smallanthus sonchifolius TaxID=185202 RepID=A0ACB9IEM0_9ASTR|nr:hypothetical protein L1987_22623 [Smallanthus sonchifolius]
MVADLPYKLEHNRSTWSIFKRFGVLWRLLSWMSYLQQQLALKEFLNKVQTESKDHLNKSLFNKPTSEEVQNWKQVPSLDVESSNPSASGS